LKLRGVLKGAKADRGGLHARHVDIHVSHGDKAFYGVHTARLCIITAYVKPKKRNLYRFLPHIVPGNSRFPAIY
jgi:hypothetical protein